MMRFLGYIACSCIVVFAATEQGALAAEPTAENGSLRVAAFSADVTPPLGSPCAYLPAERILDPLYARGIVLLTDEEPIVLCAIDWIGIANASHDAWREALAEAAGTTPQRVAVHTLHQHDAPRDDLTAEHLLDGVGLGGRIMDRVFVRRAIQTTAEAVTQAIAGAEPVTHLGLGEAPVKQVASNRRILGPDGNVQLVRFSSSKTPEAIAAPEGTIDPVLKLIAFYNEDRPVASLTYYACHPQSWYREGDVSADFVGLARALRDEAQPETVHVHFNGAGGNVAAGKYNDGSKQNRPVLTRRLAAGMEAAWQNMQKRPLSAEQVQWQTEPVQLPLASHLNAQGLQAQLAREDASPGEKFSAADKLAYVHRVSAGVPIELACLRLDDIYILHMPGELFVEYQLAAQQMRPEGTVAMAAYGDYGPGYIGTEISYSQGGYEVGPNASMTAPEVEAVLVRGMARLLGVKPPQEKIGTAVTPDRE